VALAKTLISEANFLLLDEPTNHLDFQSVNILIQALQQYEGTFITVSHDRHFIKGVANKIWYIEQHQIKEYPGTYEEFEFWRSQQQEANSLPQETKKTKEFTTSVLSAEDSHVAKKEIKRMEEQLSSLEREIEQLEVKKLDLEKILAQPELYLDESKAQECQRNYQDIQQKLQESTTSWENLVDQLSSKNIPFS
jgi:ATP-binding cassette subfamily F protein 3